MSGTGESEYATYHTATGRATVNDVAVAARHGHVVAVSQDRRVTVYSAATGRAVAVRSGGGDAVDDPPGLDAGGGGAAPVGLTRVAVDEGSGGGLGGLVATAGTDRCVRVHELAGGGALVARLVGHGEAVTGVAFCSSSVGGVRQLVTCGADGVVLVWRVGSVGVGSSRRTAAAAGVAAAITAGAAASEGGEDADVESTRELCGGGGGETDGTAQLLLRAFLAGCDDGDLPGWAASRLGTRRRVRSAEDASSMTATEDVVSLGGPEPLSSQASALLQPRRGRWAE
ncbi:hypothetical protein HK405_002253, partial [Cladochytrium tenue]